LARRLHCGHSSRKTLAAIDGNQWNKEAAIHLVLAGGRAQLLNHDERCGNFFRPGFTFQLMDLDDSYGFKASFQIIPEKRYEVPDDYVCEIRSRESEFNFHDLNHDGRLYRKRQEFVRRAARINSYVRRYDAWGFRAGSMYRNQDWYDVFEFSYDMSVPNVAHQDPLRGGCCTVMPDFVRKIVELTVTTAGLYALSHLA
jgi:hypothetical protein